MTKEHERDPFDLSAQQEADIRKEEATRLKRENEVADVKWLLGHKQGRRIVWRMLEQYGVYRSSFRTDALEMAFLEGARNHGLQLIADIHEHAPDRYVEMIREAKDNARRIDAASRK